MTVTIDQAQKIRLLSDGKLYDKAVDFVQTHLGVKVSKTQLSGLLNAVRSGDWSEIFRYIDNRINRKTTSDELKEFYQSLKNYLNQKLYNQIEELLTINLNHLNRNERTQAKKQYAHFLAKEFIQHLVAEYNYQRSV